MQPHADMSLAATAAAGAAGACCEDVPKHCQNDLSHANELWLVW